MANKSKKKIERRELLVLEDFRGIEKEQIGKFISQHPDWGISIKVELKKSIIPELVDAELEGQLNLFESVGDMVGKNINVCNNYDTEGKGQ